MLHITNGDCAVAVLSKAVEGHFLPWRDVLHEGPVHADLPLRELSRVRAGFIASAFSASETEVQRQFADRDAALAQAGRHEEVVLWFEHDLYDQLQLIQLLDWFAAHPHPTLTLVCEAEYLGNMAPARAADLFTRRAPVTRDQMQAGSTAWASFGADDPRRIGLDPVPGLPFLAPALERLLEELPWVQDGLSRIERQTLEALRDGPLPFTELFPRAHQHREEPVFLGDTVLRLHLSRLEADGLIRGSFDLTPKAREALDKRLDTWSSPRRPRWVGGYEVKDGRLRWDPDSKAIHSTSGGPRL